MLASHKSRGLLSIYWVATDLPSMNHRMWLKFCTLKRQKCHTFSCSTAWMTARLWVADASNVQLLFSRNVLFCSINLHEIHTNSQTGVQTGMVHSMITRWINSQLQFLTLSPDGWSHRNGSWQTDSCISCKNKQTRLLSSWHDHQEDEHTAVVQGMITRWINRRWQFLEWSVGGQTGSHPAHSTYYWHAPVCPLSSVWFVVKLLTWLT